MRSSRNVRDSSSRPRRSTSPLRRFGKKCRFVRRPHNRGLTTTKGGGATWSSACSIGYRREIDPLDRDTFFEAAYGHFAEAGVWELYPDVREVLEILAPRFELAVVSNFDGRLRLILNHLGIAKYFRHIFLSSELGADKPDPLIYQRALGTQRIPFGRSDARGRRPEARLGRRRAGRSRGLPPRAAAQLAARSPSAGCASQ